MHIWITLALFTLVSEDLACVSAGVLVANGELSFLAAVSACFVGIFIGDSSLYFIGRWAGSRNLLHKRPFRWIVSKKALRKAKVWTKKGNKGLWIAFAARFLPGSRLPIYVASGILEPRWGRFIALFTLAIAIWTPAFVGAAFYLGQALKPWIAQYERWALPIAILALASIWVLALKVLPFVYRMRTWEGRRINVGSIGRKLNWEYWPTLPIYLPVALWYILISVRFGLRSATCANPGMQPASGLTGELKHSIFESLHAAEAQTFLPAYARIAPGTPEARTAAMAAFINNLERLPPQQNETETGIANNQAITKGLQEDNRGATPPLCALKPNRGELGVGVHIIYTAQQALNLVSKRPGTDYIAQAYAPGVEYGIFYVRLPGQRSGFISSVTHKKPTSVVGNGTSTLRHLILKDKRAVRMAPFFFKEHKGKLSSVPAAGQRVRLSKVGAHSRGTLFLNGAEAVLTPELTQATQAIARAYPGFHYGRLDIKAPSAQHLRRGQGLKVLEINGLTSEPTHMYHPSNSLLAGWYTLCKHWYWASKIGAANRKAGAQPPSYAQLLRLIRTGNV